MRRIALLLAALLLCAAGPAEAAVPAKTKRCKKGYVLTTVKRHGKKVKVCKKRPAKKPGNTTPTNDQTQPGGDTIPGAGGDTPAGGDTDPGTQTGNQAPPSQTTRDDAAGQQAMAAAGDLLLERAEFGSSGRTATYYRIWMLGDGSFKYVEVGWNDVSGEICSKVQTGTWVFKEGYTYSAQGGGTIVKVTITFSDGQSGDDLVTFNNADPNAVFVGVQGVRFDRNPNMNNNC